MTTDKKLLSRAKRLVKDIYKEGYELKVDRIETVIGTVVDNLYLIDKMKSGRICLQKHIKTINRG